MVDLEERIKKFFVREYEDEFESKQLDEVGTYFNENEIEVDSFLDEEGVIVHPDGLDPESRSLLYDQLSAKLLDKSNKEKHDNLFVLLQHLSFRLTWDLNERNMRRLLATHYKNPSQTPPQFIDLISRKKHAAEFLAAKEFLSGREKDNQMTKRTYFLRSLEHRVKINDLELYSPPLFYHNPQHLGNLFWEIAELYFSGGLSDDKGLFYAVNHLPEKDTSDYSNELTDFRIAFQTLPSFKSFFSHTPTSLSKDEMGTLARLCYIAAKDFYWCMATTTKEKTAEAYQYVSACYDRLQRLGVDLQSEKTFDCQRVSYHQSLVGEDVSEHFNHLKTFLREPYE